MGISSNDASDEPMAVKNLIRNKVAPQNVSLFLWRLLNI